MEFMAPNKIITDRPKTKSPLPPKSPKVLVVDVGGTNVKMRATGQKDVTKIPSGPTMSASKAVDIVKRASRGWDFDRISLGYPGPIINGRPLREPHNLGGGWVGFDYEKAFGVPVRIVNDGRSTVPVLDLDAIVRIIAF